MNLNTLWEEVNQVAKEKNRPPVSYENFFTVLFTLESKGMIDLTDESARPRIIIMSMAASGMGTTTKTRHG